MPIKDRDMKNLLESIRDAADELEREIVNLEETIEEKDGEISELEESNSAFESENEDLKARVEELEEALAEAYLTSEPEDEEDGDDKISEG